MTDIAIWIGSLVFVGASCMRIGFCRGRHRQLDEILPELHDLRDTVARLRLLSKLKVCGQCRGERNVYNRLIECYQPCSICKGEGEVRHGQ